MEELFNKPVLDQMYDFRKEDFEQTIYDNNAEIKEIESKVYEVSEKFNNFLKKVISDSKNYHAALEMFRNYELTYSDEIEFWNRTYFKLGMTDREKIRNEFFNNKLEKDEDTYFNNETNDISEWVEEQKRKYTFGTKEYKELQKRYNEKDELLGMLSEDKAKSEYHTHTLRHTGATLLYNEKDINIFVLKKILGHECLEATEIYTHVSDKKLKYIMENCTISSIIERNGGNINE